MERCKTCNYRIKCLANNYYGLLRIAQQFHMDYTCAEIRLLHAIFEDKCYTDPYECFAQKPERWRR